MRESSGRWTPRRRRRVSAITAGATFVFSCGDRRLFPENGAEEPDHLREHPLRRRAGRPAPTRVPVCACPRPRPRPGGGSRPGRGPRPPAATRSLERGLPAEGDQEPVHRPSPSRAARRDACSRRRAGARRPRGFRRAGRGCGLGAARSCAGLPPPRGAGSHLPPLRRRLHGAGDRRPDGTAP